jgi:tRNA nucleotidyltransferase (CCA-adding enzyme)
MADTLIDDVYEKNVFSPLVKRAISSAINEHIQLIKKSLSQHEVQATVVLGGSSAKGTFLNKGFDCDIFVRFDYKKYKAQNDALSDILEPVIADVTKGVYERVHGSRDYYQFNQAKKGNRPAMVFEIIPVLYVEDPTKAMNVTDVSPLHVEWIKQHISASLIKEIVVTKLFLKAQGLYGAESYIKGFSGHDVDILMVHYGSFENLAKAAQSWKPREVIDVAHLYRSQEEAIRAMNASKLGPLILVDPVQPERNAAASLSMEKLQKFIEATAAYLKEPSASFFVQKPFSLAALKKQVQKNTEQIIVHAVSLKGKRDVVGSKLLKIYIHLKRELKKEEFAVIESDWFWDTKKDAYFWLYISKKSIDHVKQNPIRIHKGPPLSRKDDCAIFRSKYKNAYEDEGRLFTRVKRDYLSVQSLVKALITDEYVQQRVQTIQVIK